jgi:hypothetical protein
MSSRLTALSRLLGRHTAPRPLPRKPADPRALCMVLGCGNHHTTDTHGWKTCGDHAPSVVSA